MTNLTPSPQAELFPAPPLHIHIMGLGGIGMSSFARLLHAQGYQVSGCDVSASPLTDALNNEGIRMLGDHHPSHIDGVDILVASEAVPKDHPELVAARQAGIPIKQRMSLMAPLLEAKPSIGVVGTHGKTTTTSMIAIALEGAGLDPSAFVGGLVREFGTSNARVGHGPFVAEIDESDRHFAELRCETAVFVNADEDHIGGDEATYWSSKEEQHAAFARFVSQARRVLYNADWEGLDELSSGNSEHLTFGESETATYRATHLQPDTEGTSFTVLRRGEPLCEARVAMPGQHNVLNALAALAVTDLYGGDLAGAVAALRAFRGPLRRWQIHGECQGALVIDDYAHNHTKVAAAVQAGHQTGRTVRVVFQPHRFLRTQQSWKQLADALMNADEVMIVDIAAAREKAIEGVHARNIAERMTEKGHRHTQYFPDHAALLDYLRQSAAPGQVIVTMGAGDIYRVAEQLVEPQP